MILVRALRHRRERPPPRALPAPGRGDDAHALYSLHGAHHIHGAREPQPARAHLLHEAESPQPLRIGERRRIAAELAAVQLEAEELEPFLEPHQPRAPACPRHFRLEGTDLPQAQERSGVEAGDHHLALGHQHPLDLAQHVVRVGVKLQHVRQRDQVDALRSERQLQRVRRQRSAGLERQGKTVGNAVLPQEIDLGQADLQRPEAEHVVYGAVKLCELPVEHISPLGCGKPPGKRRAPAVILLRPVLHEGMLHHAQDRSRQSVQGQLGLDAAQRDARRGGRSRRSAPGARLSVARAPRARRDSRHAPPSGPCRRHRRAGGDAPGSGLWPAQGTDPHADAAGVRRRQRSHPRARRRFLGDRHPRAYARAHRLLWGRVAVLWRHAVRVRLRAPVRRHRRADVRVAAEAARAARRHQSVLRARVHARQHRLRQNRRAGQRRAQAARGARPAPARGGQADAAEHAGRGKGHQSLPALPRARGGRVGQQVPRGTHSRSCESIRRNTGLEEPLLKNKRVLAGWLIALLQACASQPVPPELPGEQAAAAETPSPAPPRVTPQPALPPASLPDAPGLAPFEGEQRVVQEPLRGLRKIDRTERPADLWQRIRQGFAIPDLDSALVEKHTAYLAPRPEYLQRVFDRSRLYLYHIVEEIEKRGLPTELALLPMVESAFNPMAYSRAHASGLWQFIPGTGRRFELKQNWWYDGRRDIVDSTTAALDYLTRLYELHGDWQLALASYNWGENGVARAIAKNRAARKPTDYANLKMPTETRTYIPKLQALKNIISNPALFGIVLDPIPNAPYFAAYTELREDRKSTRLNSS